MDPNAAPVPPVSVESGRSKTLIAAGRLLIVLLLYALGRGFEGGWWRGIGVGGTFDAYSFEDHLYLGFFALAGSTARLYHDGLVLRMLSIAGTVFATVAVYVAVGRAMDGLARLIQSSVPSDIARRHVRHWLHRWPWLAWLQSPLIAGLATMPIVLLVSLPILLGILVVIFGQWAGEREGAAFVRALADRDSAAHYARVALAPPYRSAEDARLIQCSGDWCLIYSDRAMHLLPKGTVLEVSAGALPLLASQRTTKPPRAGPTGTGAAKSLKPGPAPSPQ